MPSTLIPAERNRLDQLEAVVDRGLETFHEVGNALLEIQKSRLYRESHSTWDAYTKERFGFSRQHAYRLIDGAKVAELVSPVGDIGSERAARELVPLLREDEEEVIEVPTGRTFCSLASGKRTRPRSPALSETTSGSPFPVRTRLSSKYGMPSESRQRHRSKIGSKSWSSRFIVWRTGLATRSPQRSRSSSDRRSRGAGRTPSHGRLTSPVGPSRETEDRVSFTFTLQFEDGLPAEPATFHTAVPNWRPGDAIPLGHDRTLRVVDVRDGESPDDDVVLVVNPVEESGLAGRHKPCAAFLSDGQV